MSMDGITNVIDWIGRTTPSKLFWGFVLVVYALLLFEQFTDHYRLTRLTKAVAVVESLESGDVQSSLQIQLEKEAQWLLLPKQASPWWLRMLSGAAPFIILQLAQLFSDRNIWGILKMCLIILLAGGLIALIPDFLPTWKYCLGASLVYVWGFALVIVDDLKKPLQ
jgi:hypothetical protein